MTGYEVFLVASRRCVIVYVFHCLSLIIVNILSSAPVYLPKGGTPWLILCSTTIPENTQEMQYQRQIAGSLRTVLSWTEIAV